MCPGTAHGGTAARRRRSQTGRSRWATAVRCWRGARTCARPNASSPPPPRIGCAQRRAVPGHPHRRLLGAAGLLEDFGTPATQQWSVGPLTSWSVPATARARACWPARPAKRPRWRVSTRPCWMRCAKPRPCWTPTRRTCSACRRCAPRATPRVRPPTKPPPLPGRTRAVSGQPRCRSHRSRQRCAGGCGRRQVSQDQVHLVRARRRLAGRGGRHGRRTGRTLTDGHADAAQRQTRLAVLGQAVHGRRGDLGISLLGGLARPYWRWRRSTWFRSRRC